MLRILLTFFALLIFTNQTWSQKKKLSASDYEKEAAKRMKAFKLPINVVPQLWADTSQTKNPSAICFDSEGKLYVAEIHRWRKGVDDIRYRRYMMLEDIKIQSSADRMAMFKNHLDKHPMEWYTNESDRIVVLEDKNKDGRADSSTVYADGFNDPLDGPGIGLIERDGKVYYTNIPHLWMLEDTDGDGKADKRKSLQDGFGIRMSFSGHDMHGLIWGPDGKLYWSIGDRGYSFTTKEGKKFHGPNEGAVFRCDPDGSNVEVFYDRLRNPQELQFDDYGNLFTADNDGDKSDLERINYLVEGGDSGWNAGHQALMSFTRDYNFRSWQYTQEYLPNPWETDLMWKVRSPEQPQFILPGIGQINGGPSGFLFNPANSMGKKYDDKYFVIHYKGSIAKSYISMFDIVDDGAGFKTQKHEEFFRGSNCVDIEFGPDGKMYMSDYNYGGWGNQDVGNIYTFHIPEEIAKLEVKENEKILLSDFSKFPADKLYNLLGRDHLIIRQRAQFELAKRGEEGLKAFEKAMSEKRNSTFTRIHGVWGIGQMAYKNAALIKKIMPFITDENDQVRIQVARVLGDHKVKEAAPLFVNTLKDIHARAAMYAGIGLGRIGYDSVDEVMAVIKKNADKDLFLRHGMIMALHGLDKSAYIKFAADESPSVRLAVLLALRKKLDPQVAHFLNDQDKTIRYEAIRAINDRPIIAATSKLAEQLSKYLSGKEFEKPSSPVDQLIHHRIINANYNSGRSEDAARLLAYAANSEVPERQRMEALAAIQGWGDKHPLDSITGLPRNEVENRADIKSTVHSGLEAVFKTAEGKLLAQATRIASKYDYALKPKTLMAQLLNSSAEISLRKEALSSLMKTKHPELVPTVKNLLSDEVQAMRLIALSTLVELNKDAAVEVGVEVLKKGETADRQNAWRSLGKLEDEKVKNLLIEALDKVIAGKGDAETALDVIDVARVSPYADVKAKAKQYESSLPAGNMMAKFKYSMLGGSVENGKDIFMNHGAAQCVRCHKVKRIGADVGPNLTFIGDTKDHRYLLESIVDPGVAVADGYGMVSVTMKDGSSIQGVLAKDTDKSVVIKSIDGKSSKTYKKADIKNMTPPTSGMPPMHMLLNPFEIRDVVAYLSSLKNPKRKDKKKKTDSH